MTAKSSGEGEGPGTGVALHQIVAVSSPDLRTSDLLGNFSDFESLFEQLDHPNLIELGKPLPAKNFRPRKRAGSCPAAHNEALLGKRK